MVTLIRQNLTVPQFSIAHELVADFFRRIYAVFLSVVHLFCGCFLGKRFNWTYTRDAITHELAKFNNPRVYGQINGVYITTNESNLEGTRELLESEPRRNRKTIHIGCAAWHNLDILCARQSTYGLIVDFNPKNAEFMGKTVELIHACASREAFTKQMIQYLDCLKGSERYPFFHSDQLGQPTDRIEEELSREGSWLESEENYQYIKTNVVAKGRLIAITEDIRKWKNFSKIRSFLDKKKIAIDTVYMSNICHSMRCSTDRNACMRSLRQLVDRNTICISCPNGLVQNAVLGFAEDG